MKPVAPNTASKAGFTARPLSFGDLTGWDEDDHQAAWACFERSGALGLKKPAGQSPRAFFETHFTPCVYGDGDAHYTGYYEPEIEASKTPTSDFAHPIYAPPPELSDIWHSRADIEASGILRNRGLEIAWLRDPLDVFFLQVQGSGRLLFEDGTGLRVGFASKNGHPYKSIGAELIRRGAIRAEDMTAETIKAWIRENGADILLHNPSYIFFKTLDIPEDHGPLGAMTVSVTPLRTLAVDPEFVTLGAPVWTRIAGVARLCTAQDVGSAIKGQNRADLFCGTGDGAGQMAGTLNTHGFMAVLTLKGGRP